MKRLEFKKGNFDKIKVICKNDGEIALCNALCVNGTCIIEDCLCKNAIAVIAEKKDYITRYLALED